MLEKNLSCLYKTAWAHVRRKDDYIETLKLEIKDFRKLTGMVTPGVPADSGQGDENYHKVDEPCSELNTKCDPRRVCVCQVLPCHTKARTSECFVDARSDRKDLA